MDIATLPTRQPIPFAESAPAGNREVIPQTSQIGITAGAASYPDGFPPVCLIPIASGGTPPWGRDMNGILYNLTLAARYIQAGGNYPYDSTFSTAVGGYPKGSLLLRSDAAGQWLSTADNNTTDPDSTSSANWIAVRANTGAQMIAMASGANVPTANQLGAQVLLLTGTLTANATLTLPLRAGAQWTVVNNTTGAFAVTVQGATGAGVSVTQGTGIIAYTDGTNFYAISAAVSGAYLPIDGTAVAATKLATARAFNLSGIVTTAGAVNFDGTANVTINITDIALTAAEINTGLGYTAANDTAVVHLAGAEMVTGAKTFSGAGAGLVRLHTNNTTTSAAPWVEVVGGRGDANTSQGFSGTLLLANNYTLGLAPSGQALGTLTFGAPTTANDLTTLKCATSISGYADGAWSSTVTPSGLRFYVGNSPVPIGGAVNVTYGSILAMQLDSTGLLTANAGATVNGAVTLNVAGQYVNITGTTAGIGAGIYLLGDGVTTPSKIVRARASNLEIVNNANSIVILTLTDAGGLSITGAMTATGGFQSSDRRAKTNIKPRQVQRGFALTIARMFCEWDRIADGVHDVGLVAQRVKALASRYVIRGKKQGRKAGMLAIDKSGIALEASMDCALQLEEQKMQLKEQAKTIKALMRRIEKLEK